MSRVIVVTEYRYRRTPDGQVWAWFRADDFFQRYLDAFDEVTVVARALDVPSVPEGWQRCFMGERVRFHAVPHYIGPLQFARRAPAVIRSVRSVLRPDDAVILRLESNLGWCMEGALRRNGHPYGVEVVDDPYEIFAPGATGHRFSWFWRWRAPRQLRRMCWNAAASSYVTAFELQRRYPPRPDTFTTHYSSAIQPPEAFVAAPRQWHDRAAWPRTLVLVATMDDFRKGQITAIDAITALRGRGLDVRLVLVGDGLKRVAMEEHARTLGISERVRFVGLLPPGAAVRAELDNADVFVLPSFGEGLPRSAIEAMARGLPVIGTDIGGFRELLPADELLPCGDDAALARSIEAMVTDPAKMTEHSARNLARAQEYRQEVLAPRRRAMYSALREATEAWSRERR